MGTGRSPTGGGTDLSAASGNHSGKTSYCGPRSTNGTEAGKSRHSRADKRAGVNWQQQ